MASRDVLSIVLVLVVGLTVINWLSMPRPRPPVMQRAGWLFWAALLLETVGFLSRIWGWNNNTGYNLFQPMEFVLVLLLVRTAEPSLHRWVLCLGTVGLGAFAWSIHAQGGLELLSANAILVFCALLTIVLVRLLFLMARKSTVPLQRMPTFWLFLGCLLYFAGLVPVIGGVRLIYDRDPALAAALWMVVPVLAILRYVLATWACLIARMRTG
jgi:hypothetical protein